MNRRTDDEVAARWVRSTLDQGSPGTEAPEGWRSVWAALELPGAPAAPAGFARQVARAWGAERALAAAPILGAAWMRAAAAAALLAGIALGTTLSGVGDSSETASVATDSWASVSLSEEYLRALATPEAALEGISFAATDDANDGSGEAPEP